MAEVMSNQTVLITIIAALALAVPATVHAGDALYFIPRDAFKLGLEFDGSRNGDGDRVTVNNTTSVLWLNLPVRGALMDRRVLSYHLMVRPKFIRRTSNLMPAPIDLRSMDLNLSMRVLSAKRLTGKMDWGRVDGSSRGGFGTSSHYKNTNITGAVSFRNSVLPMNASASRRRTENFSHVGIDRVPLSQLFIRENMSFRARNRKITVEARLSELTDLVGTGSFSTNDLSFAHLFTWGKGSRLQSNVIRTERKTLNALLDSGLLPSLASHRRTTWREHLKLRHTKSATSNLQLEWVGSKNGIGKSQTLLIGGNFNTRVTRHVSAGLNSSWRSYRATLSRQDIWLVAPTMALSTKLKKLTFNAVGSVGYQDRDRRGALRFFDVFDTPEKVNPTGIVLIDQPGVDPSTIVVTNDDGTIVYQLGLDYSVVSLAGSVELRVLPGSRISTDDLILLSYRFASDPTQHEDALLTRYSLGMRYGRVALRHARSERESSVNGGSLLVVPNDFEVTRTSLTSFLATPAGPVQLRVARRARRSFTLNYVSYEFGGSIGLARGPRGTIQFDTNAKTTVEGGRRVRTVSARPSGSLVVSSKMKLNGSAGYWLWQERGGIKDSVYRIELGLRWHFGSIDARVRGWYEQRQARDHVNNSRISLFLERRI